MAKNTHYLSFLRILSPRIYAKQLFVQVYKVQVHIGKDNWFIFRRYNEFDKLYNSVSLVLLIKVKEINFPFLFVNHFILF